MTDPTTDTRCGKDAPNGGPCNLFAGHPGTCLAYIVGPEPDAETLRGLAALAHDANLLRQGPHRTERGNYRNWHEWQEAYDALARSAVQEAGNG